MDINVLAACEESSLVLGCRVNFGNLMSHKYFILSQ